MTRMLASVRDLREAEVAAACGVDLLDLKDPSAGALGALPIEVIREIVSALGPACPFSATIGDLPCEIAVLEPAIARVADCGVLVKVGIFGGTIAAGVLRMIERRAKAGARIVLVFFAEDGTSIDCAAIADAGVRGVMIDTRDKRCGSLTARTSVVQLRRFVAAAAGAGLMTGLAGSLRAEDVVPLSRLGADYLGFRGALCAAGNRAAGLDGAAVKRIRALIDTGGCHGTVAQEDEGRNVHAA